MSNGEGRFVIKGTKMPRLSSLVIIVSDCLLIRET